MQPLHLYGQVVEQATVFGVGEGGKEQRATQAAAALDQRDLVSAQRCSACRLHAGRAAADHQHMAGLLGLE